MTDYDNTNRFVLFVNDKKGNEKRPDRTGTLNVDGVEYFIDGWIKNGAKGAFLAGTIKRKEIVGDAQRPATANNAAPPADEDIPFAPIARRSYL